MRRAVRYAVALAMTVLAGWTVDVARPPPIAFPAESARFDLDLGGSSRRPLQVSVRSTRPEPSQLTVILDGRQASFIHPARSTVTYRLTLPPSEAAGGRLQIQANPPASLTVVRGSAVLFPRRQSLAWQPASPALDLPEPMAATDGDPTAAASVDETDTYGLRLFGVPVRTAPTVAGGLVAMVAHGDRLEATCWRAGDPITNGFPERPLGAYTSDIWFRVSTPAGSGFIPDTRFSRRGNGDRLNLPACAGT